MKKIILALPYIIILIATPLLSGCSGVSTLNSLLGESSSSSVYSITGSLSNGYVSGHSYVLGYENVSVPPQVYTSLTGPVGYFSTSSNSFSISIPAADVLSSGYVMVIDTTVGKYGSTAISSSQVTAISPASVTLACSTTMS